MKSPPPKTLFFKQSHFATHLPVHYRYTPSHFWAEQRDGERWRLGLTRFATRMLGDMVDHGFETEIGASVSPGQVVGWIEGFKAISDVICVGHGTFAGGNPALKENVELISESTYDEGWLYEINGHLDDQTIDVNDYAEHLKLTIDRILEKQKAEES